jgi:tRNA nucleotidyltransferase/poly(A) polymerase
MNWQPKQLAFRALLKAFLAETAPLYIVGGVVRDFLLDHGNDKTDIDLVVEQAAVPIAQRVANRLGWAFYPLDADRDVARLVFVGASGIPLVCDVAALRGGSLEADLRARDFTINAMAFVLARQGEMRLVDLHDGREDLDRRLIRRITASSFAEDPVRLLRAVRFMVQLDFTLEEETHIQIKRMSTTVKLASPERIRDELWKTLITAAPAQAIDHLRTLGLLAHVLPEVHQMVGISRPTPHAMSVAWSYEGQEGHVDSYEHTLHTVECAARLRAWLKGAWPPGEARHMPAWPQELAKRPALGLMDADAALVQTLNRWHTHLRQHFAQPVASGRPRFDWLVWHALFHAEAPDIAVHRLTHLRFSRQEITLVWTVVQGFTHFHTLHAEFAGQPLSRRACYRFFREISGKKLTSTFYLTGIDAILLALADYQAYATAKTELPGDWFDYLAHAEQLFAFAFADNEISHPQAPPLVDGQTLMANLHLSPGRQVGEILEVLSEAQATGDIRTADEALAWAARWMQEQTLEIGD